ncbi:hypothetical protein V8C42DRAFT_336658 [Trichoderma barbatum]
MIGTAILATAVTLPLVAAAACLALWLHVSGLPQLHRKRRHRSHGPFDNIELGLENTLPAPGYLNKSVPPSVKAPLPDPPKMPSQAVLWYTNGSDAIASPANTLLFNSLEANQGITPESSTITGPLPANAPSPNSSEMPSQDDNSYRSTPI